jgi:hypothetical protein
LVGGVRKELEELGMGNIWREGQGNDKERREYGTVEYGSKCEGEKVLNIVPFFEKELAIETCKGNQRIGVS